MINLDNKIRLNKNNYFKFLLFFCFATCILSVSTDYDDLLLFKLEEIKFSNIINFTRQFSIIIIFFICFYKIIDLIKNKKLDLKKNIIFILAIFYFLIQSVGLVKTNNSIENITYITSSITFILVTLLCNYYLKDFNDKKILISILTVILSIVFLISFFKIFYPFISGERSLYGAIYSNTEFFLNKYAPRSSGMARTLVFILIFLNLLFYNVLSKKRYISEILKIFTIVIILNLQSRAVIGMTIIVFVFFYLLDRDFSLKNTVKYVLLYIIIPLFILFFINLIHSINFHKKSTNGLKNYSLKENLITTNTIRKFDGTITSGRINDWNLIYEKFKSLNRTNKLFGYGAQGDRYSINQTASSGIFYALISSGIVGLIIYIFFTILVFIKSIKLIYYNYSNYKIILPVTLILITMIRSIVESSYAVFGIDFIVFFTSILIINDIHYKIKK